MEVSIIGGTIDEEQDKCRQSSIVNKISSHFIETISHFYNGCILSKLPKEVNGDLVLWMPDINNEEEKNYPIKEVGAVLVCSKVMREGYKRIDAVSRIFKMHGNAVIEIYKENPQYRFCLVDALGNEWCNTTSIDELCDKIKEFYNFTKSAVRVRTKQGCKLHPIIEQKLRFLGKQDVSYLMSINKKLQEHVQTSCGNRFFGNISTRCQKLFPSTRVDGEYMFVSPRNSDKSSLEPKDMILYDIDNNEYYGDRKPSVDSPCQALLYKRFPNVYFMIHGHAHTDIPCSVETKNYKLCGDVTEVQEILDVLPINTPNNDGFVIVNLKNHGFLIMAGSLSTLKEAVDKIINEATIEIK